MLQIITIKSHDFIKNNSKIDDKVEIRELGSARSLDDFSINIINLNHESLWKIDNKNYGEINRKLDLVDIGLLIKSCNNRDNIVVLPQNYDYKVNYSRTYEGYTYIHKIKDYLDLIKKKSFIQISQSLASVNLVHENTETKIIDDILESSFTIKGFQEDRVLTKSIKSNRTTTVDLRDNNKIIITTLDLKSTNDIYLFLKEVGLIEKKEQRPRWIKDISILDDKDKLKQIKDNKDEIEKLNDKIHESEIVLEKNNRLKSILYTNGDELVEVVFEILEEILSVDLSSFEDEKKEDFVFKIEDTHYIGEIKGVSHNVKSQNISQLDVHYQSYIEDNQIENEDDVKAILIINHQRNCPPSERQEIHEDQEKLALRNGSLIVETSVLLNILEKYREKSISTENVIDMFNKTGVLKMG